MSSHLLKADHSLTSSYTEGNLLPLPTEGTDAYSVHTYESLPTHPGGSTIFCPTTIRTVLTLTASTQPLGTNIWILGDLWNADIFIPPSLLHYTTMIVQAQITVDRTWELPSAASLVSYLLAHSQSPLYAGSTWVFSVCVNGAVLIFAPGAGCTLRGNTTYPAIADGRSRTVGVRLTNVTPGAEAYEFYIF